MNQIAPLSETGNDRIVPGGNRTPFDLLVEEIDDLYMEAKNWADGEPIGSQEIHDEVEKLYDGITDAGCRAELMRAEEVTPHDTAKAAIQARFHPLIGDNKSGKGRVILAKAELGTLLAAWRVKVKAEKEEAARKAREEADRLIEEAQAAMQSSSGSLEAREQAEEQLSFAKDAEKYAKRTEAKATTGNGLRSHFAPELTDLSAAIKHYWATDKDEFEGLVLTLARRDVIAGKRDLDGKPGIPGFVITSTAKAL